MALTIIGGTRGVFASGPKTLTFAPAATVDDVLLALVAHNAADLVSAAPAGWALIASLGSGADALAVYSHVAGAADPAAVVFGLATVASEWQGELVAIRGPSPGTLLEASGSATFTAATALSTAVVTSQQAVNELLAVWTCSGAPVLTLPVGFTAIDSFASSVVSSRSMLVGHRRAGATGSISPPNASANASTTGRSFTLALRDRVPPRPAALEDLVPGNIGLIARDTRPAR